MKIVTKVKGIHEFGKKSITNNVCEYELFSPRMCENDILIYYYPQEEVIGIYQVTKELSYFNKDDLQVCRGLMNRLNTGTLGECITDIGKQNFALAKTLIDVINKMFDKYSYLEKTK